MKTGKSPLFPPRPRDNNTITTTTTTTSKIVILKPLPRDMDVTDEGKRLPKIQNALKLSATVRLDNVTPLP